MASDLRDVEDRVDRIERELSARVEALEKAPKKMAFEQKLEGIFRDARDGQSSR